MPAERDPPPALRDVWDCGRLYASERTRSTRPAAHSRTCRKKKGAKALRRLRPSGALHASRQRTALICTSPPCRGGGAQRRRAGVTSCGRGHVLPLSRQYCPSSPGSWRVEALLSSTSSCGFLASMQSRCSQDHRPRSRVLMQGSRYLARPECQPGLHTWCPRSGSSPKLDATELTPCPLPRPPRPLSFSAALPTQPGKCQALAAPLPWWRLCY